MIIVVIDGREAIPVRAIPFVTGWMMPPQKVAGLLSHAELMGAPRGVCAYQLQADGNCYRILPKEWDNVRDDIEILADKLKADEKVDNENLPTFRRESIELLPAGVFVWKDEFEQFIAHLYSADTADNAENEENDDSVEWVWTGGRDGDGDLNLTPLIPMDLRAVVVEGFAAQVLPNEEPTSPSARSHVSKKLAVMNQAAKRFWGNADRDDRKTHEPNSTVVAWLEDHGFSPSLAEKAATIIRPEWAPRGRKPDE